MGNRLTVGRTFDDEDIIKILKDPDIWETIADHDVDKDSYQIDHNGHVYLAVANGLDVIGLYVLHAHNSATLVIHANILKKYRKEFATRSGELALSWLDHYMPDKYQKVIAEIPEIYEQVYHFARNRGFEDEGRLTKAYWKNDKLYDIHILGMSREAISNRYRGLLDNGIRKR